MTLGNININIAAVNDDPTASLPASVIATEDTESNLDLSAAEFSDLDDNNLTVTLTVDSGIFSSPADGSGVGSGVTETLVNSSQITLSGSASDINTYLNTASNIKYTGTQNTSGNGAATITVTVNDGAGSGNMNLGNISINITAVNDSPVIDADPNNSSGGAAGYETTFAAGSPSGVVIVDTDFSITDIDDTHIESAVITLAGALDDASESLAIDGSPATVNGISITYTSANEINLSGSATIAQYQSLIQQIRYQNSENALDATPGDRTISIRVDDGGSVNSQSNTINTAVSVVAAPVVNSGPDVSFVENDGNTPVSVIASSATIIDADSANLSQMVITLTNNQTDDRIFLNGRNNSDTVTGITITYDSDSQITLSGTATKAEYLVLLKELQFVNTSDNPDTTDRNIAIATTDTDSYTGNASTTVSVSASDDPSVVSGDFTGTVTEGNVGDSPVTATGGLTISDVDTTDNPYFADQAGTNGDNGYGVFVLANDIWTYTLDQSKVQHLDAGDVVSDTINYIASDGSEQVITVTINGQNDASIISGNLSDTIAEGNPGDTITATGTLIISDVDEDDSPAFNDQAATQGDNGYGTFTLINGQWEYILDQSTVQELDAGDVVTDRITYTATTGAPQEITVTINGTDDTPVVTGLHTGSILKEEAGDGTVSGTLGISDRDNDDNPVFTNQPATEASYGQFVLQGGVWTYTLDASKVESLSPGTSVTDTVTYSADDGTQQIITVTISARSAVVDIEQPPVRPPVLNEPNQNPPTQNTTVADSLRLSPLFLTL